MIDFQFMRRFNSFKDKHGQITTLFVVILGVLLLFITIMIDMAQVSMTKTSLDISVDSGSMMLGSLLTSRAKSLSDLAIEGRVYEKKSGGFFSGLLGEIIGWVLVVAAVIVGVLLFWNPAGWAILSGASGLMVTLGAAVVAGLGSWMVGEAWRQQAVMEAYCDALRMLNSKHSQYREQTLLGVVAGLVNDPDKVVDTGDINRNGRRDDWVGRFDKHYSERMRLLVLVEQDLGEEDTQSLREAIDDIRDDLEKLKEISFENSQNLRSLAKEDSEGDPLGLWEVFLKLDSPGYDSGLLSDRIQAAEDLGYSLGAEAAEIKELAQAPGYNTEYCPSRNVSGQTVTICVWDIDDPHAESSDQLPFDTSENQSEQMDQLCQISQVIYDIYYTDSTPEDDTYFIRAATELLENPTWQTENLIQSKQARISWADLVFDGTTGPSWNQEDGDWEGDMIADSVWSWEKAIGDWREFFNLEKIPELENDRGVLNTEIADLEEEIKSASDPVYKEALENLKDSLNETKSVLDSLYSDVSDAEQELFVYETNLEVYRRDLEDKAEYVKNWQAPVASGIGGMMYAWKNEYNEDIDSDDRWHVAQAKVAETFKIPWVETKKKKKWNKTTVKVWIRPYDEDRSQGYQQVEIAACRFDEPVETAWWNFYPSQELDAAGKAEWESLKEELNRVSSEGAVMIAEGEKPDLYNSLDDFLGNYGMRAKSDSFTQWAGRSDDKSKWKISVVDPE